MLLYFFLFSQCAFIPYGILALAHIGLLQCIEVLMFYPQLPLTYGQLGQCKLSRRTRTKHQNEIKKMWMMFQLGTGNRCGFRRGGVWTTPPPPPRALQN